MITPCPRHISCPPGTGTDTAGTNYSSEHVDVPEYTSIYYDSRGPYSVYQALGCIGRCLSYTSQEDANLCAQRQAKDCSNYAPGTDKPQVGNTAQVCTEPNTGRTVVVPPDVFTADSVEEANAQALAYANALQKDGNQPPGVHVVPTPSPSLPTGGPNSIPKPVPQPHKPTPPPPSSHCKPCDDSSAVSSFSLPCDVDVQVKTFESPPLKCGTWQFTIVTDIGGALSDPPADVLFLVEADDPARTSLDWFGTFNCDQMAFQIPCGPGAMCDPRTTLQFGQNGCCNTQSLTCSYASCQTIGAQHYLIRLLVYYYAEAAATYPHRKFTINGTLVAPLP